MPIYKGKDGNNYYYVICAKPVPPFEDQMKPGDIVKFSKPIEPGDQEARFMVLENRGDRVLVKPFLMFVKQEILPNFVYLISELEIVK